MIQCPACMQTFDVLTFRSWIMRVQGTARIDYMGKLHQIGPLRATTTIKKGHELQGYLSTVQCPHCKYEDKLESYTIIIPCVLTGKSADMRLSTVFGDIAINSESISDARRIFTDEALQAMEPLERSM